MSDRVLVRRRETKKKKSTPLPPREWCGLCQMDFPSESEEEEEHGDPRYQPVASQCRADLSHVFHQWCIDEWVRDGNHTCPTCNVDPRFVLKRRAVAERVRARQQLEKTSLRFTHVRCVRYIKRHWMAPAYHWAWESSRWRRLTIVGCALIVVLWAVMRVASALKLESSSSPFSRDITPIKVYDALLWN